MGMTLVLGSGLALASVSTLITVFRPAVVAEMAEVAEVAEEVEELEDMAEVEEVVSVEGRQW